MKQTVLQKSMVLIIFLFATALHFAQSNNDIVKQVQSLLEENYIFLDKAKETNMHLEALIKKGVFNNKSSIDFANLMTKELQKITKDKHLYFSLPNSKQVLEKTTTTLGQSLNRYDPMLRGLQLWESNIGYIDLAFFGGSTKHRNEVDAVMKVMEIADAIIIDMRRNGGGFPRTVNYLCSYFFNEKLLLNTIYSRANNHTEEFWVTDVKGIKRPEVPVYILTSDFTFSGAEDLSYTMQSRGRAVIIGEVTGGGAHPTEAFSLDKGFRIGIPFARTINPITKTNWEGVGVQPDIKIEADNALEKAKELAKAKAIKYRASFFKPLEEILTDLESKQDTNENNLHAQLDFLVKANKMDEEEINNLGYSYIRENKPQTALSIFKSNTLLFPNSANTWDSLAEGYFTLNNKEKAILYYNKVIKMDPEGVGENAREMLNMIEKL
ncbi:S41 family peptidase [Flavivirga jejuensis]|uniref:S41 family peptidase n=2 Tax=Pseudomonadati TaxID=3379134 RepID=A0ABT8WSI3_9FLAO|nr:S41 family peptidase [Flavivirga jejuensis]MDO5976116.1 S41 family peptidase [Flavivirga jejuensis]